MSVTQSDPKMVLVLEDDPGLQDLLVDVLSDEGYVVLQATNGMTGLSLAEQHTPDAILLNAGMPPTSGLDVLERLKRGAGTQRIPVVALTGDPLSLQGRDGARLDGCVQKPFDIADLLEQVERAVER